MGVQEQGPLGLQILLVFWEEMVEMDFRDLLVYLVCLVPVVVQEDYPVFLEEMGELVYLVCLEAMVELDYPVCWLVERLGREEKLAKEDLVTCLLSLVEREDPSTFWHLKDMGKERMVRARAKARIATKIPLDLLFWTLCPTIFLVRSLKLS